MVCFSPFESSLIISNPNSTSPWSTNRAENEKSQSTPFNLPGKASESDGRLKLLDLASLGFFLYSYNSLRNCDKLTPLVGVEGFKFSFPSVEGEFSRIYYKYV